ncbi:uncharacterized protein FIBRA_06458 [Fibroporia radiculosa]|uniref:Uncharacterized protein n=1 Tax=Fibroporia radiculosa TaxID=599839 RepID=J4HZ50_9APHY|nr:uncharacterized protein FIBRA_06458 [Fibroporia radiculosa]CCM04287.1 predicted protein [Fibroporia radiculosa]
MVFPAFPLKLNVSIQVNNVHTTTVKKAAPAAPAHAKASSSAAVKKPAAVKAAPRAKNADAHTPAKKPSGTKPAAAKSPSKTAHKH